MHMLEKTWLIPAIPMFSFLFIGLIVRPYFEKLAGWVGTLALLFAALCSYSLAFDFFSAHTAAKAIVPWSFEWLRFQPGFSVVGGVLVDSISVMLMTVVTTVSFLVHLYSIGYMHEEEGYGRYFTYLSLFTFSMLGLVAAPNIVQMYVFWELVGASSFLLIGFYYQKPSAVSASKKAFIVTRFADLGFLIGILVLGHSAFAIHSAGNYAGQPFDFAFLTNPEVLIQLSAQGTLGIALVLIFMGAAGKSAMFPLHIWLPDAMEGPTPVSALIHAATMVVAGVYLVARMFPAFSSAPGALEIIAYVGLFTSAFAAVIACTQDDIKRVLAFSTLSQLGYMMFSLGIATLDEPLGFSASMFHLYNHAFFKALLFLGAGSVIHGVHSNDVWKMGGLRRKMPVTHITFLIAVLAISGIWPFSGFFSKDEILSAALEGHRTLHFVGGLIVAGLTAFYMARIYFLAFWGSPRSENASHAHEAPITMLVPLIILAVFSMTTGFIPFAHYVAIGRELPHEGINFAVAIPGTLVALLGLAISWFLYVDGLAEDSQVAADKLGIVYTVIKKKFYIDELYLFITHKIIFNRISAAIAWFDRTIVDGSVNFCGYLTRRWSAALTLTQTGQLQTYGMWFVLGVAATSALYWFSVR